MRIGDLAKRAGVNIQTVRFYERERVLRTPLRTRSGYRSYSDLDLQRLVFIQQWKHMGFTLREIRQLAALHDTLMTSRNGDRKPLQDICVMAQERLQMIDEKILALQGMKASLLQLLSESMSAQPGECPARKLRAE
jgi:DNA-binding transcriptional MerR regulator